MVSENTLKAIVAMICVTALQIVNFLTVRLDTGIMTMVITAISIFAGYQIGYYKKTKEMRKAELKKQIVS